MVVNPEERSSRIEVQIISMLQLHFPQINILNVTSIAGMCSYGYTSSACSNSASPNVHSTLRSKNREEFGRRSSTVGPCFITMLKAKDP